MAEANEKLTRVYRDEDKRGAAEFLVSQIELLKEERRALIEDNDSLNQRLNDSWLEIEQLKKRTQVVDFLEGSENDRERKLFERVEELEDLLIEQRQKSAVSVIIDLESQITSDHTELARKEEQVKSLNSKIKE